MGRGEPDYTGGCQRVRRMPSSWSSQDVLGTPSAPLAWRSAKGRVWLCPQPSGTLGFQLLWVVTVPSVFNRPDRTGVSTQL